MMLLCLALALHDVDGPIRCKSGETIRLAGIGATELDGSIRPGQPGGTGNDVVIVVLLRIAHDGGGGIAAMNPHAGQMLHILLRGDAERREQFALGRQGACPQALFVPDHWMLFFRTGDDGEKGQMLLL